MRMNKSMNEKEKEKKDKKKEKRRKFQGRKKKYFFLVFRVYGSIEECIAASLVSRMNAGLKKARGVKKLKVCLAL